MDIIHVEPFRTAHICPELLGWLNDRELMAHSQQRHLEHTIESQWKYVESFADGDDTYWGVWRDGALIGTATICPLRDGVQTSILISEGRKGYGRRALQILHAMIGGAVPTYVQTEWENMGMRMAALRAGMEAVTPELSLPYALYRW